jgi:threonine synthase
MSGSFGARPILLERFRDLLPVTSATPLLTLGEGATPLVRVPRLGADIGASDLWLKVEGANPTGSFKDRGMVMAVAKAAESGARAVVCASTGNTSASAAAYAAAAGLEAIVLLPAGKIAAGKLLQAFAAGAKVISIDGNFDVFVFHISSPGDGSQPRRVVTYVRNDGSVQSLEAETVLH